MTLKSIFSYSLLGCHGLFYHAHPFLPLTLKVAQSKILKPQSFPLFNQHKSASQKGPPIVHSKHSHWLSQKRSQFSDPSVLYKCHCMYAICIQSSIILEIYTLNFITCLITQMFISTQLFDTSQDHTIYGLAFRFFGI